MILNERHLRDELAQLRERQKELNCLYRFQDLIFENERPLPDVLESIVNLIGEGWQRPDSVGASIEYFGRTYSGEKYRPVAPKLREALRLENFEIGSISVSDSSLLALELPDGGFLEEERKLLRSIASSISEHLGRSSLRSHEYTEEVLKAGHVVLETASRQALVDGETVNLSATEFVLLEYMLRNQGKVLKREELLHHVWQYDFSGDSNVLHVYISYLRKKIERESFPKVILTVRGVGYRIQDQDSPY